MGRYLIIANQTLGGAELRDKIRTRIQHGEGRFHVVVPLTVEEADRPQTVHIDPRFAIPPDPNQVQDGHDRARKRAQHRLDVMVSTIEELGGEATGELGPADPYEAAKAVLEDRHFNEVIVSTLPLGISRWINMDLVSRIQRLVEYPVTTVEAGASVPA